MKKLLNDPAEVVKESLTGLAAAHADLVRYDAEAQILVRATPAADKVGLISGGGSGHEPMHGGFVGPGMLDAACRRGVGATVLAEKIAGAAAERGDDLAAVAGIARRVNERARSYGVALSSCTPPAAGAAIFDLPDGEMEVGIGIHGEPGRERRPLGSAAEIAELMLEAVLSDLEPSGGASVLPFVNGMGGTPQLELYLLYGEIERRLRERGLRPERRLVGSYITSLEMAGASLTLLELDDELTALWDAPVQTPALHWGA
jgi:dihydroxyacetone kinase-like protein